MAGHVRMETQKISQIPSLHERTASLGLWILTWASARWYHPVVQRGLSLNPKRIKKNHTSQGFYDYVCEWYHSLNQASPSSSFLMLYRSQSHTNSMWQTFSAHNFLQLQHQATSIQTSRIYIPALSSACIPNDSLHCSQNIFLKYYRMSESSTQKNLRRIHCSPQDNAQAS